MRSRLQRRQIGKRAQFKRSTFTKVESTVLRSLRIESGAPRACTAMLRSRLARRLCTSACGTASARLNALRRPAALISGLRLQRAASTAPGSASATAASQKLNIEEMGALVLAGDRYALSRAITLVESTLPEDRARSNTLLMRLLAEVDKRKQSQASLSAQVGRAARKSGSQSTLRIGISGPPGYVRVSAPMPKLVLTGAVRRRLSMSAPNC